MNLRQGEEGLSGDSATVHNAHQFFTPYETNEVRTPSEWYGHTDLTGCAPRINEPPRLSCKAERRLLFCYLHILYLHGHVRQQLRGAGDDELAFLIAHIEVEIFGY